MLSLFKDQELPLSQEFAQGRAREILISYLNKGIVPEWDQFFHELPVLQEAGDLEIIKNYFLNLTKWCFLENVLASEATEFFFHGPNHSQVLFLDGNKRTIPLDISDADWQLWLEIVSIYFRQNWNVQQPFVSFYGKLFGKQFRFSLVHSSTSPEGKSKLVLRSLAGKPHPLSSFGDTSILDTLVAKKNNLMIVGSTGSGKTSLLTSLLEKIPSEEHLIILEDTYEILSTHKYQTRFLAGSTFETSLKSYLSYSLRLSPDRIVLGEMRSHEVIPFLMAMNTGHKGLMGTIHASSAIDGIHRMALLFSLYSGETNLSFDRIMELICRNLECVVFMENKKVKEVIKILGCDKGVPFYEVLVGERAYFS